MFHTPLTLTFQGHAHLAGKSGNISQSLNKLHLSLNIFVTLCIMTCKIIIYNFLSLFLLKCLKMNKKNFKNKKKHFTVSDIFVTLCIMICIYMCMDSKKDR